MIKKNIVAESISINYTTLILGDSQIQNGLSDLEIDSSLNVAKGGDPIFYSFIKLKALYKIGFKPDRVILGWTPQNYASKGFYDIPKTKDKVSRYFFLFEFEQLLELSKHNFEGFVRGIINFFFVSLSDRKLWKKTQVKDADIGGFWTLPNEYSAFYLDCDEFDAGSLGLNNISQPENITLKYLQEIITFCQVNSIELILIRMPNYVTLNQKNEPYINEYRNHVEQLNGSFEFWDYSTYLSRERRYFYNEDHLNGNGALLISRHVDDRLKLRVK